MRKKQRFLGQKYGCPIYGMCWPAGEFVYMAGGGGLGIENKLLVISCRDGMQSEELGKLNTGKDAVYRMVLHPSGRHIVCGMSQEGLERVDLTAPRLSHAPATPGTAPSSSGSSSSGAPGVPPALSFASGWEFKEATKDVGAVKGMSFSSDGRYLALGGEDGSVDVREWPHMRSQLRWQASEKPIRNVDFSAAHSDGLLFTCDEAGICKLWNATSGAEVAQLHPPTDMPCATFFRCKSALDEQGVVLFTPIKWKREGWLARWRQDEDGSIRLEARSKKAVTPAPICGFEVSRSGELLAAVTPDGDQCVMSAATLQPIKHVRNAHMTFATCVAFSPNERFIISGASDASAVLTRLPGGGGSAGGALAWLLVLLALLVALLAVALGTYLHLAAAATPEPTPHTGLAALIAAVEQRLPYRLREALAAAAGGGS